MSLLRYFFQMINRDKTVQVSDTTRLNSSNAVHQKNKSPPNLKSFFSHVHA